MDWLESRETPLVIGHRGLAGDNIENTIQAISDASQSCDMVEIDVRQLRDGTCVVFHDEDMERATGESIPLSDVLYEEVSERRVFDSDEIMPTLPHALSASATPILLEIKPNTAVETVLSTVSEFNNLLFIQSFDSEIVRQIATVDADYPVGLLCASPSHLGNEGIPDNSVTDAKAGIQFIDSIGGDFVSLPFELVSEDVCSLAQELGVQLFVWNITSQDDSQIVSSLGVSGLIIDTLAHKPDDS